MNKPGINPKTFKIKLDARWYGQEDPVRTFVEEKINELKTERDKEDEELWYGNKPISSITEREVKTMIEDVTYSSKSFANLKKAVGEAFLNIKEVSKDFNLDNQIKDGYMYEIRGANVLATGAGGVRMFIEAARKRGLPDLFIAQDIYVFDYTTGNGGWIGTVKWTPIENKDDTGK